MEGDKQRYNEEKEEGGEGLGKDEKTKGQYDKGERRSWGVKVEGEGEGEG